MVVSNDVYEQRDLLIEIANAFLDELEKCPDVDISIEPLATPVGDLVQIEEMASDA